MARRTDSWQLGHPGRPPPPTRRGASRWRRMWATSRSSRCRSGRLHASLTGWQPMRRGITKQMTLTQMTPTEHEERPVEQLSGLDGWFLAMETSSVYGHVGSVCIVEAEGGHRVEPLLTLEHLTRLIESRLPLVPLFRRRLVTVPLGLDHPYWIDDPDFDIEFHIRELALPSPGSDTQLSDQVARIHARPLDRSRPLWELYLITGLRGGRAAIYSQIHHSAIEVVSGGDIDGG